jgi:hypothetical protein
VVQTSLGRKWDSISKITRAKWTGDVARAVELLLNKYEALSWNPSTTKKEKEVKDKNKNKEQGQQKQNSNINGTY